MNILCTLSTFNGIIPIPEITLDVNNNDVEMWTGKQVLSYIIPPNINLNQTNSSYDTNDNDMNIVKIIEGNIEQGPFDKGIFTKTSIGLIHTINNDLGPERCKQFIDDLQKIVTYFLLIEGFSVGISDMIADSDTNNKINEIIHDRKAKIRR